ncbi:CHAT domain-containing protein [Nonlabens spongiae]|uniref:CHAT domain-containing protein n=1 Tax=Nonlabens spongiae TaxID=331648 RepID=UPI00146CAAE8|nr:CHAT domain-containing protein [Nonlabens spongiae]
MPSFKYAQLDLTKSLVLDDFGIFAPKYSGKAASMRGKTLGRLNGAIDEYEWLSNEFSNSDLITVSNSEDFLNKIRNYEILHLAMHTVADASLPDEAVMYISDDEEVDLETLYNTGLNSKLVFLSSCQSARVDDSNNNISSRSIHRAFAHSGVSNTIASLYEVPDDVTSKITQEFYTHLKAGNSSLFSLSLAKQKYLKGVKINALSHPYYWSGLVHNGLGVHFAETGKNTRLDNLVIMILSISIMISYTLSQMR